MFPHLVIMAQKKERHVSLVLQKLAPSSSEKSTPPMGAPNAAATPAAAPHATKSRVSRSERISASIAHAAARPERCARARFAAIAEP